jgi:hypothetical protein
MAIIMTSAPPRKDSPAISGQTCPGPFASVTVLFFTGGFKTVGTELPIFSFAPVIETTFLL